jgi:hypothetical protein
MKFHSLQTVLVILLVFTLLNCIDKKQETKVEESNIEIDKVEVQKSRYCFIHDVREDDQKVILLFDEVEYKNDSVKNQPKILEMPNGYYFTDKEKKLETLEFDSNSVIIMQTFSFADDGNFNFNQSVKITDFIESFDGTPIIRIKSLPFKLVSTGTKVDSLIEIYIP